jgi:hypothetical protein
MPRRTNATPCPECGTPLGEVPFKRNCLEHALHLDEIEGELRARESYVWQYMAQRERFDEDPGRAFDEACDRIDKLTDLLIRLTKACHGDYELRMEIIAEAEEMNDV